MVNIKEWLAQFLPALQTNFPDRIWFVGLQGSYARGEATETSDIDIVVILDELTASDVQTYRAMLDALPHRELICGFLAGKREIMNWDPSDLFQFYHDTQPITGSLDELLPLIDAAAISKAIKMGAGNIYHGCVHNMLHERSEEILRGLYKAASFVVQAICYQETGRYFNKMKEVAKWVSPVDRMMVENYMAMKNGTAIDLERMSEEIMSWASDWLIKTT